MPDNVTATRSETVGFICRSPEFGAPALNPPHDPGASEPKDFAEIRRKGKTEERNEVSTGAGQPVVICRFFSYSNNGSEV